MRGTGARGGTAAERDVRVLIHGRSDLGRHLEAKPMIIAHGEGVYVYDDRNRRSLDAMSAMWCASLGYSEQRLVEAATRQMQQLPFFHSIGLHSNNPAIDLAEALLQVAPTGLEKVLLSTTGSEAVELAVKLVWFYHNAIGRPRKKKIVSLVRAAHGSTIFAASMSGNPVLHTGWDLPLGGVLHTDCPSHYIYGLRGETEVEFVDRIVGNLERLIIREGPETIGAFIAEPVLGAGGVIVPPPTYFEKVQQVLRRYDVLLIADEIVCGFGRTGAMFGSDSLSIRPDMMIVGKGLSAGYLPISGTLVSGEIFEAAVDYSARLGVFSHASTYAGHPSAAAVALEALRIYEERDIVGMVRRAARYFHDRLYALRDHPIVGEARGIGLLGALQLVKDKASRTAFAAEDGVGVVVQETALRAGVILHAAPDSVRLCPPLIISETEMAEMFDALRAGLDAGAAHACQGGFG
jgi:4-aminobutyrate---pyruvate transaminase